MLPRRPSPRADSGLRRVMPLAGALIALAASSAPRPAHAQEAAPAETTVTRGQRSFGVGATVGFWAGAGGLITGAASKVKWVLSGGYAPVLVFANDRSSKEVRFNGYNAFQVNGDLQLTMMKGPRTEAGLLLGYKFNNVIGHGGGAGVGVFFEMTRKLALHLCAGLAVFPSAKDRLDRDHAYPGDRQPSMTPAVQAGANLGMVFYP